MASKTSTIFVFLVSINLCRVAVLACDGGWYGAGCKTKCSDGCAGTCGKGDGYCTPCKSGWYGYRCDIKCSDGCASGTCDKLGGSCTPCKNGWYGDGCNIACGEGCAGTCDNVFGGCTLCKSGWYGNSCELTCSDGCASGTCSQWYGSCTPCKAGWYGDGCNITCSDGCTAVDGKWGRWNIWGDCSATCGESVQSRSRQCDNPRPAYGGKECEGASTQILHCAVPPCAVDGNWGAWGQYGPCSETCGPGTQTRNRYCDNPRPDHGGRVCAGGDTDTQSCNRKECPVDGQWGWWSGWSACSTTCGQSVQSRSRQCDNPRPAHGGKDCEGTSTVTRSCAVPPCAVDGNWGSWGQYGYCSATCGTSGTRTRNRYCDNPAPAHGGRWCTGGDGYTDTSSQDCNRRKCQCYDGWYGQDCRQRCSSNCQDTCDKVSGYCTCRAGWTGDKCDQACLAGWYGDNCTSSCSVGCADTCHHVDGQCTCRPGWYGAICDTAKSPVTDQLLEIQAQVSSPNFTENDIPSILTKADSALNVVNGTEEPTAANDVALVTDIVTNLVELNVSFSSRTAERVLETVSSVAGLNASLLLQSRSLHNTTNKLLDAMDKIAAKVKLEGQVSVTLNSSNFVLKIWDGNKLTNDSEFLGLRLTDDTKETKDVCTKSSCSNNNTDTAIYIPQQLLRQTRDRDPASDVRVSASIITSTSTSAALLDVDDAQDNQPFTTPHPANSQASGVTGSAEVTDWRLSSKVISLRITVNGQPLTNLSAVGDFNVTTVFTTIQGLTVTSVEERRQFVTCAFWDYGLVGRPGAWSGEGCYYTGLQDGRDVCTCNHLTNFAMLMDYDRYRKVGKLHKGVLHLLSTIFLSMSIFGLSITILSFLLIKSLRVKVAQQTLFHLSLALLTSSLVFVAGFQKAADHHAACLLVAILLHYSILASFMWMLVMGVLQYIMVVKGLQSVGTMDRFLIKASVPAWGLPLVAVVVCLCIDLDLYSSGQPYCWLSLTGFYYGLLPTVGIVILCNLVIYVMVMTQVCRRRDMSHGGVSYNVISARASIGAFIVLGLSWTFGFLAIAEARLAFQYLFTGTTALQGFLIFLIFTAREQAVQTYWRHVLRYDQIIAGLRSLRNPKHSSSRAAVDSEANLVSKRSVSGRPVGTRTRTTSF